MRYPTLQEHLVTIHTYQQERKSSQPLTRERRYEVAWALLTILNIAGASEAMDFRLLDTIHTLLVEVMPPHP